MSAIRSLLRSAADQTAPQRFTDVFGELRAVLAVVHVLDFAQTMSNVAVARTAGCDGVFLVNHDPGVDHRQLAGLAADAASEHPGWFVGLNALDATSTQMLAAADVSLSGVWADDAGVHAPSGSFDRAAADLAVREGWPGLYFGSVAFKYQAPVEDPPGVASAASEFVDVVTTSGSGTGSAPSEQKLSSMRAALGAHPFAVASGVDPSNAEVLARHVDAVLCATGISSGFHTLDPALTADLVDIVHGLGPRR